MVMHLSYTVTQKFCVFITADKEGICLHLLPKDTIIVNYCNVQFTFHLHSVTIHTRHKKFVFLFGTCLQYMLATCGFFGLFLLYCRVFKVAMGNM